MDDVVGLKTINQAKQHKNINKINTNKTKTLTPFESSEASLLEGDGVVVVDVVDPKHLKFAKKNKEENSMNSKIKNAEDLLYEGTVYDCSLREEQIVEKMPLGTEVIPLQSPQ